MGAIGTSKKKLELIRKMYLYISGVAIFIILYSTRG